MVLDTDTEKILNGYLTAVANGWDLTPDEEELLQRFEAENLGAVAPAPAPAPAQTPASSRLPEFTPQVTASNPIPVTAPTPKVLGQVQGAGQIGAHDPSDMDKYLKSQESRDRRNLILGAFGKGQGASGMTAPLSMGLMTSPNPLAMAAGGALAIGSGIYDTIAGIDAEQEAARVRDQMMREHLEDRRRQQAAEDRAIRDRAWVQQDQRLQELLRRQQSRDLLGAASRSNYMARGY